jgi:hypothetical protein
MKYNKKMMWVLLLCVQFSCAYLQNIKIDIKNMELLSMEEMRFCFISFVRINGQKYVIKQKKPIAKILSVVRDTLTAHIAEIFVPFIAHQVGIIPAGIQCQGKFRTDWPATIHTVAPGKMVKDQHTAYDNMNIKQADVGFRADMLSWMAKNDILIIIVALDTFVCNHDRHRGNLFYQAKNDAFCAIDMDSAFKHNLCALACRNFTAMLNDRKFKVSSKELRALSLYHHYLQFLIDTYKPEGTIALYDDFVRQAGFVRGSDLYTDKVATGIANNKRMIMESYKDAQRLVLIIDELLKKLKKNKEMVDDSADDL